MNIESAIEYLLVNIFYVYILSHFVKLFFDNIPSKMIFVYMGFYFVNSTIHLLIHSPMWNVITSVLGIFLITCFLHAQNLKRVAVTSMIYVICMMSDILIATLISGYLLGERLSIVNNIASYLFIFCIEIGMEKYLQLKNNYEMSKKQVLVCIGVPIISLCIILIQVFFKIDIETIVILTSIGLLFINILVFYLYDLILKDYEERYKALILEREVEEYRNEIRLIEESQKKVQGLRHDMQHHVMTIRCLANDGETLKILQYLGGMADFIKNPRSFVSSGNPDVDSVLNFMIQRATDLHIFVNTNIKIADNVGVDFFDLNVVLGNLLENAIESAKESIEKTINISLEYDRNVLYIEIENSYVYSNKLIRKNGNIVTSKKESGHGFGLQNVKLVVQKYNGDIEIMQGKEYFTVIALMYL